MVNIGSFAAWRDVVLSANGTRSSRRCVRARGRSNAAGTRRCVESRYGSIPRRSDGPLTPTRKRTGDSDMRFHARWRGHTTPRPPAKRAIRGNVDVREQLLQMNDVRKSRPAVIIASSTAGQPRRCKFNGRMRVGWQFRRCATAYAGGDGVVVPKPAAFRCATAGAPSTTARLRLCPARSAGAPAVTLWVRGGEPPALTATLLTAVGSRPGFGVYACCANERRPSIQ